jgi:ATP-dependent Zn protease
MYQIHNRVNDKLGVPLCERPSLKEVVECYSNYIATKQTPTTEEERINRRMKGCQSAKKKFSCKVSVFDNTESKNVNEKENKNIKEDIHYLNEKKSQFTNMNDFLRKEAFENKNDNNFLVVILSIIIIILIISVLHLYFKKK